jgi:outer membrane protein assembly factor BamB
MRGRIRPFLLAVALVGQNPLVGAEWPQFRGPTGDGVALAAKLPVQWSEEQHVTWKAETPGRGWSSPIIADDRVWLTAAVESQIAPDLREQLLKEKLASNPMKNELNIVGEISLRIVGFDAQAGTPLVDRELAKVQLPQPVHSLNSYASPTPIWHNGRVYCHFGTFGTFCYDIESDDILWHTTLELQHSVGPGSSPVLVAERLVIPCDGADRQFVTALDIETGQETWNTPRPKMTGLIGDLHKAFSTPLVITVNGKEQVVVVGAQWVVSYDPADGREIWKVRHGEGFSNVPCPVFGHGMVSIATGFMRPELWAIRVDGTADVTKSHVAWKASRQIPTMPSPVVAGDEIYFVNDQGVASCLDALSGDLCRQKRFDGNYCASPLAADGKIYFFSREGKTTVLRAGRDFERLAENALDGQIFASPAVIGNALVLRTDTHLYRIED